MITKSDEIARAGDRTQEAESGFNRRRCRLDDLAKILKRVLLHTAIVIAVFIYTIGGGYIFYWIERPHSTVPLQQTEAATNITSDGTTVFTTAPKTRMAKTILTSSTSRVAATATNAAGIASNTANGLQSWLAWRIKNTTKRGNPRPRSRKRRQLEQSPSLQDDDYDEEDEADPEKVKKKLCNQHTLRAVVESARKECVLAHAPQKDKAGEFRAHLCSSLLAHLASCVLKPGTEAQTTAATTIPATTLRPQTTVSHKQCESAAQVQDLTPSNYIFMAFTIISTIGYGHVAPVTAWGRIFCIVYGLFGIPLALLAIADQGRFLSAAIIYLHRKVRTTFHNATLRYNPERRNVMADINEGGDDDEESMPTLLLLVSFGAYMLIGGAVLTPYEKSWSYVDAVYFTFISSSSIGFGDLLPQEGKYLPLTLFYVALGLALSTAAIDVFAGYLRKLHHWGKKIRNCANKLIWFGSEKVTLKQLIRSIGAQLGVPEEKINHLVEHFDEVVVSTIQQACVTPTPTVAPLLVKEPPPPLVPVSLISDIDFIDDKED